MTSSSAKRPAPLSIRISERERAILVARASGTPLSAYIKSVLFADLPIAPRPSASRQGDREALAKLLAWLGQTQTAASLAILASAAESGSLDMSEPVTRAVMRACADIDEMRTALMRALGKEAPPSENIARAEHQLVCHSFLSAAERMEGKQ